MKRTIAAMVIIAAVLAGCATPAPGPAATPIQRAITPRATLVPPTEILTATPTDSPTPTPTATPTSEPTRTPAPTPTPLPPLNVSFYRLRVEYSTTSDWTDLHIQNPTGILTMRLMGLDGNPTRVESSLDHLALNQPLEAAEAAESVGMTVDYAIKPEALDQPLTFLLQKGALNGSIVRLYNVVGDDLQLIQEIDHHIVVEDDPGFNPLPFSVDLSTLRSAAPRQMQIERLARQRMLWAFYYPWYSIGDWASPILRDRPATRYSSDDPRAIARHVEQAQSAGIDGFISSWWGPDDYTDENLKTLLDIAHERGFLVTVYFETLKEGGPLSRAEILDWLTYLISAYRDHPAFMKVDGKPLVAVWASREVPLDTWRTIFSDLRTQGLDATFLAGNYGVANLEVFDGLHEYGVFLIPDLAQTFVSTGGATRYYPLLSESAAPKIWAATVQPGYDDRLIPGREGLLQQRNDGAFYRSTFDAALQSDPDWIFITTWNEWWEHTHIEPSELFGDLYLQITREYAEGGRGNEPLGSGSPPA